MVITELRLTINADKTEAVKFSKKGIIAITYRLYPILFFGSLTDSCILDTSSLLMATVSPHA